MEALESFPEECDKLWVLGDLVTYGPNPAEVVNAVRARASLIMRGNHDQAASAGDDPRCSDAFGSMAAATLDFARACYAVWQDGNIDLRSYEYPVEETVRKILAMPVPDNIRRRLANVLRSGGDPNRNRTNKETSCSRS